MVEQKYFTDRAFLQFTRDEERRLIEEYLGGQLSPTEKRQFEQRYLTVPQLNEMVEDMRRGRGPVHAPVRSAFPRWILAAAVVLLGTGGLLLWQSRGPAPVSSGPVSVAERPILATLLLSPGVSKSEGPGTPEFVRGAVAGSLQLVLELPGLAQPASCVITVAVISADGDPKEVWSSRDPVASTPIPGGQQISVVVDTVVLTAGDYLVRASESGQIRETYTLRVR